MFTGLIREVGTVVDASVVPGGLRIWVRASGTYASARDGDSISVDGCCLTVAGLEDGVTVFELSNETLDRTIAGEYRPGHKVNIEPSLTLSDKLGGHMVTGHVDTVGRVASRTPEGDFERMAFELEPGPAGLVAEKGSISVNGVSLTVASWSGEKRLFDAALIPETLTRTNLSELQLGDPVNIEYDLLARYVVEALKGR